MGLEVTEDNRTDGARIVESFDKLATSDFDMSMETVGNVAAAGMDALGFIANPLGMLGGAGIGWLIEHVSFLKEPLDDLAGDPDQVTKVAAVWGEQVGKTCEKVGAEFERIAQSQTASWQGKAADSYRSTAAELAGEVRNLASAANIVQGVVQGAGVLVAAVRGMIRDMIADVVAEIIIAFGAAAASAIFTAGGSMAAFAGWATARAASTAGKIAAKIQQLLDKISDVMRKFDKLKDLARKVAVKAVHIGQRAKASGQNIGRHRGSVQQVEGRVDSANNLVRDRVPTQVRDLADRVDGGTGARARDGFADTINPQALRNAASSEAAKEYAGMDGNYEDAAKELREEEKK